MSFLTMMLAMAMMFMANDANAANFSASSQSIEADAVNESDYDISMDSSLTLQVNETFTLTPVIIPATAQTSLSWYSEDDLVARVSDFGVVTALTVGTTEIVARAANGKKVKCTVTVTSAAPNPIGDLWTGSYQVTTNVDQEHVSEYNFPSNFTVTIKEIDGAYYVTEFIGMDLTQSIYEGLRINVIDEQYAEIDLTYTNDLGYRSMTGCFLSCIYLISPNSDYELGVLEEGKIGMTRRPDGSLFIDDFYVFAFGLVSNFELAIDAAYHSVESKSMNTESQSSSVSVIIADKSTLGTLEIYNLNGMLVFSGDGDLKPELEPGMYVFRQGNSVKKVMVH